MVQKTLLLQTSINKCITPCPPQQCPQASPYTHCHQSPARSLHPLPPVTSPISTPMAQAQCTAQSRHTLPTSTVPTSTVPTSTVPTSMLPAQCLLVHPIAFENVLPASKVRNWSQNRFCCTPVSTNAQSLHHAPLPSAMPSRPYTNCHQSPAQSLHPWSQPSPYTLGCCVHACHYSK